MKKRWDALVLCLLSPAGLDFSSPQPSKINQMGDSFRRGFSIEPSKLFSVDRPRCEPVDNISLAYWIHQPE